MSNNGQLGTGGSALGALIREHMENTGDTLADIATRGGLARQTVSRMLHSEDAAAMPRRRTLEGLATGMGLSLSVVSQAAARTAGRIGEPEPMEHRLAVLVDMARALPVGQVDVLLATARALARSQPDTPEKRSIAV